jgi:hypothetical protein
MLICIKLYTNIGQIDGEVTELPRMLPLSQFILGNSLYIITLVIIDKPTGHQSGAQVCDIVCFEKQICKPGNQFPFPAVISNTQNFYFITGFTLHRIKLIDRFTHCVTNC